MLYNIFRKNNDLENWMNFTEENLEHKSLEHTTASNVEKLKTNSEKSSSSSSSTTTTSSDEDESKNKIEEQENLSVKERKSKKNKYVI